MAGNQAGLPFCLIAIFTLTAYRIGLYSWLNWGHLTAPTPDSSVWIFFATDTRIGVILLGGAAALVAEASARAIGVEADARIALDT